LAGESGAAPAACVRMREVPNFGIEGARQWKVLPLTVRFRAQACLLSAQSSAMAALQVYTKMSPGDATVPVRAPLRGEVAMNMSVKEAGKQG